jgi:hypothetical protein
MVPWCPCPGKKVLPKTLMQAGVQREQDLEMAGYSVTVCLDTTSGPQFLAAAARFTPSISCEVSWGRAVAGPMTNRGTLARHKVRRLFDELTERGVAEVCA